MPKAIRWQVIWARATFVILCATALPLSQVNAQLAIASAEVSGERIAALQARLTSQEPAIRGLLIQRNGKIAYEYYRQGLEPSSLHIVNSVTKSVVSLLIGIAVGKGIIPSVHTPVAELFPGRVNTLANPLLASMTLAHLLSLSSGFDHSMVNRDTDYQHFLQNFYTDRLTQLAFSRRVTNSPGSAFYYSNLDSQLVALALSGRLNMRLDDWAKQELFTPLGISNFQWQSNAQGEINGAAGLSLTILDMAKIGQLVLQDGQWNSRQIVSSDYIALSTKRHLATDVPTRGNAQLWGYGYLWWTASTREEDFPAVYAAGYGGQFIYIVPKLNTVIVVATDPLSRDTAARTAQVIRDFALPVVSKR